MVDGRPRRRDARCGVACDVDPSACPAGTFCDTGIGRFGGVCMTTLPNGTIFEIVAGVVYTTCSAAGSVACRSRKAFGVDETRSFQGWCVCGAPPGSACASDAECGGPKSGLVCERAACVTGCRAPPNSGNGCPDPWICMSDGTTSMGVCAEGL